MGSEIEGLPDLHTFVKINNYVSRFAFPRLAMPIIAPALIRRPNNAKAFWIEEPPAATHRLKAPLPASPYTDPHPAKEVLTELRSLSVVEGRNAAPVVSPLPSVMPHTENLNDHL